MRSDADEGLHLALTDDGNVEALGLLRSALASRDGVAFVGAGASYPLHPLWPGLIASLAAAATSDPDERRSMEGLADTAPQDVAGRLKRRLGTRYDALLRETFRPAVEAARPSYTATHAALLRLPLRAYVTTNYDHGLLLARTSVRPGAATGYATWRDSEVVAAWERNDRERLGDCPVLFLHGSYDRPATIVLTSDEYQPAHEPGRGQAHRLLATLWDRETLVIVGFGFRDDWLRMGLVHALAGASGASAPARHVAIVGSPSAARPSALARDLHRIQYRTALLWYPVIRDSTGAEGDHAVLPLLLDQLAGEAGDGVVAETPAAPLRLPRSANVPSIHGHFDGPPARFLARPEAERQLHAWSLDPAVRAIALIGPGGAGKTALALEWARHIAARRHCAGIFTWHCGTDRDVEALMTALRDWVDALVAARSAPSETTPADAGLDEQIPSPAGVARRLSSLPVVLVIDGLDVLQRAAAEPDAGALADETLGLLFDGLLEESGMAPGSLVLLTSRVPLHDLDDQLGFTLRSLDLAGLRPADAEELLGSLGLTDERVRSDLATAAGGHVLTLRLAAALAARSPGADLTRPFAPGVGLGPGVAEYLRALSPTERALLTAAAYVPEPLSPEQLWAVAGTLDVLPAADTDAGPLERLRACDALWQDGVVLRLARPGRLAARLENDGDRDARAYACHDAIATAVREATNATSPWPGHHAASLLSPGYPLHDHDELRWAIESIRRFTEVDDFEAAYDVWLTSVRGSNAAHRLEADELGLEAVLPFIGDDGRTARTASVVPARNVGVLINEAGVHSRAVGHVALARELHERALAWQPRAESVGNASVTLQWIAGTMLELGDIAAAEQCALEAVELAVKTRSGHYQAEAHVEHAVILLGAGRLAEAADAFAAWVVDDELLRAGEHWADYLSRSHIPRLVDFVARAALRAVLAALRRGTDQRRERFGDRRDSAIVLGLIDGQLALADQRPDLAAEALHHAQHALGAEAATIEALLVGLADARVALASGDHRRALAASELVERRAAARGLVLVQADALVLVALARARRTKGEAGPAGLDRISLHHAADAARTAIDLAERAGYPWAQRDGQRCLAEIYITLGDPVTSGRHDQLAARLTDSLRPGVAWHEDDRLTTTISEFVRARQQPP